MCFVRPVISASIPASRSDLQEFALDGIDIRGRILCPFLEFTAQREICLRIDVAKGKILELGFELPDTQAVGQRRINLERLQGNPLLLFGPHHIERAHVVQAVAELDEHHADVIDHRQEHLAQVLGLMRLFARSSRSVVVPGPGNATKFRDAIDQARYARAELFFNLGELDRRVFYDVMEKGACQRLAVQLHTSQNGGNGDWVHDVRLTGLAYVITMRGCGEARSSFDEIQVGRR